MRLQRLTTPTTSTCTKFHAPSRIAKPENRHGPPFRRPFFVDGTPLAVNSSLKPP